MQIASRFAQLPSFGSILFLSLPLMLSQSNRLLAQVLPDTTLQHPSSTEILESGAVWIRGGEQRGAALFHSFQQFGVAPRQSVYFVPTPETANIFARVTGQQPSNILGTLGVQGEADLFLLNPHGILFGPNAQLDLAGSFTATTADSLTVDNNEFSAVAPTSPSPLLAVNLSPGLQYGQRSPESNIRNQARLAVHLGQQLVLLGGTVENQGLLHAPGGLVELSGDRIQTIGIVDTQAPDGTAGIFLLDPKNILIQADAPIRGADIQATLAANDVVLQADNDITVNDDIVSNTANNLTLLAGRSIALSPGRSIVLSGGEFIARFNEQPFNPGDRDPGIAQFVMGAGSQIETNGGVLGILSGNFDSTSQINTLEGLLTTVNAAGQSGNLTLSALGDASVGQLESYSQVGNGGNILVTSEFGGIATEGNFLTDGTLQAGNITVTAAQDIAINGQLITDISGIDPTTVADFSGRAGDVTVRAGGNLDLRSPNPISRLGDISAAGLQAGSIMLTSGGKFTADNYRIINRMGGDGVAGDIQLSAQSIELNETSIGSLTRDESLAFLGFEQDAVASTVTVDVAEEIILQNSAIFNTADFGSADGGDVNLSARQLRIVRIPGFEFPSAPDAYGIVTFSDAESTGNGGDLKINVSDSIDLRGSIPGPFIQKLEQLEETGFLIFNQGATLVSGALGSGKGGDMTVRTGRLTIQEGAALTSSSFFGNGGDIDVIADEIIMQGLAVVSTGVSFSGRAAGEQRLQANRVLLADGAAISTASFSSGDAGTLLLTVQQLQILGGSSLASGVFGTGNSGALIVKADEIEVSGSSIDGSFPSEIATNSFGAGDAGPLEIQSERLIVSDRGEITTATFDSGAGADIQITTGTLQVDNGQINASTLTSQPGGNIQIQATESVALRGDGFAALTESILQPAQNRSLNANSFTQGIVTVTGGEGQAGKIDIATPDFSVSQGGLIATTTFASGTGGDITIRANDDLQLDSALLATGTFTAAPSGQINLETRRLRASGGAQALTTTFGSGRAGDLTVVASESIDLIDPSDTGIASGLFASSFQTASGTGGDIQATTRDFRIVDGATVTVSGEGTGDAGNIGIGARSLLLDQSSITATSASGEGGNITLRIEQPLVLRRGSQISTTAGQAGAGGNGGNITIGNGFVLAVPGENSDITANAFEGNGGNIAITTRGLLGIEFREELTSESDITASSAFGLDGTFTLEQTDTDPQDEPAELPSNFSDAENQIVAGCPADAGANFIVTGRGGLPTDPRHSLEDTAIVSILEATSPEEVSLEETSTLESRQRETVFRLPLHRSDLAGTRTEEWQTQTWHTGPTEAQAWQRNRQGQVELLSLTPINAQNLAQRFHPDCLRRS